jgi:hypothetical protein
MTGGNGVQPERRRAFELALGEYRRDLATGRRASARAGRDQINMA